MYAQLSLFEKKKIINFREFFEERVFYLGKISNVKKILNINYQFIRQAEITGNTSPLSEVENKQLSL